MRRTQAIIGRASGRPRDEEVLRAVCEDAAENLDADLVSVWKFEDGGQHIRCLCALNSTDGTTSDGQLLHRSDFPSYFEAIVEETMICAPDARSHPYTEELTENYFAPNGILSLLDFIVHHEGVPVGIICCESLERHRHWSEKDRRYLRALATLASFKTRL